MSRTADPLQGPAVADLLKCLRSGTDIDLVRPKYPSVPKTTWHRWKHIALDQFRAEGGRVATKGSKPPAKEKAKSGRKDAKPDAQAEQAMRGALILSGKRRNAASHHSDGGERPPPPSSGPTEDGETYIIAGPMGPIETSIIQRFSDPNAFDAHQALAIVDRLGEQYLNAEALMKASIKRVENGHVILNQVSYGIAVDLQTKILLGLSKVIKDARKADNVRIFMDAVGTALRKEDPVFAGKVVALLREAAKDFVKPPTVRTPA